MEQVTNRFLKQGIVLLVILVIFLSGCDEINSKIGEYREKVFDMGSGDEKIFQGGSEGIYFEIVEPFEEYYKKGDFIVSVELENKGEAFAEGEIGIFGLGKDFGRLSGCSCIHGFNLDSMHDIEGEKSFDSFSEKVKLDDKELIEKSQTLSVSAVYGYESYAVFEACVRKRLVGDKGCEYRLKEMLKSSSGAPVKVVSVKERMFPEEDSLTLIFDVEIKNKGNGVIVDEEETDCCDTKEKDKIVVDIVNYPGASGSCDEAVLDKVKDKYITHCTVEGVEYDDYRTDVTLRLSYTYKEIKSRIFEVI